MVEDVSSDRAAGGGQRVESGVGAHERFAGGRGLRGASPEAIGGLLLRGVEVVVEPCVLAEAVRSGTATAARSARVGIAAKTGTAVSADGSAALSLIGFAPADAPEVAVALTARAPRGQLAGEVLDPKLRRLLERATAAPSLRSR